MKFGDAKVRYLIPSRELAIIGAKIYEFKMYFLFLIKDDFMNPGCHTVDNTRALNKVSASHPA